MEPERWTAECHDMKKGPNAPGRWTPRRALLGLILLIPLLMGGCPEFRNDVVGVMETATRNAVFGTDDAWTISNATRAGFTDAVIDLVFGQLQTDDLR